jgi:hypothetical protein
VKTLGGKLASIRLERNMTSGVQVHLSLTALALVVGGILVGLTLHWLRRPAAEVPPARPAGPVHPGAPVAATGQPASHGKARRGAPGPWGEFEYVRIAIERPDEFLTPYVASNRVTRWFLEDYTPPQWAELLAATDLSVEHQAALMDTNRWQMATNGFYVTPGRELIFGLSPATRQRIYAVLARSATNQFHQSVFAYRVDAAGEWFDQSRLAPATLDLIRRLLYRRGTALCFSDVPDVLAALSSDGERTRLLKTLSRQSTLLMNLQVRSDTPLDPLVAYWGKVGRAKDLRPLLESLQRVPGGATLDVAHLLTPFARRRLYAYPYPNVDPSAPRPNCYWTSMNFFNEEPDDRFCDIEYTLKALRQDYYAVPNAELTYGDLIFLYNPQGKPVHAAVYIADEVVFTKNGAHFNQPWILMDYPDLLAVYPSEQPLQVVVYRQKRL